MHAPLFCYSTSSMDAVSSRLILLLAGVLLLWPEIACSPESDSSPLPDEPSSSAIAFTEVTREAGLGNFIHDNGAVGNKWYPEQMGSGAGFIDYDDDGWSDILLLGGGNWNGQADSRFQALWLYRNNGDGTFTEVTTETGFVGLDAYTIGLSVADYDNDGDEDIFLDNLGTNMLFRNDGGVFTEVGEEAGLSEHREWGSSAMFFDANRDGWLDLFAGNYIDWTPETDKFCPEGGTVKLYCIPADYEGIPSRYYQSNGDGTFTDRTDEAGFTPVLGKALGVAELDFNKDGWSDLVVVNDGEGDLLYQNNHDGTFTERGMISGIAFSEHGEARAGMGVDAGVVDSTGQVSIFVGNFSEEMAGVYRHTGNGLFLDRAAASRIGGPSLLTLTFGLFLFDVDLDTDLDLFVANGHVYPDRLEGQDKITFRQPAQLYTNRGNGIFDEVKQDQGVLTSQLVARGAAYADYDRDGDLDILIVENDGPAHLWRNDLSDGNVLRVDLTGTASNREAIGARIVAQVGSLRMERRMRTGSSYLSQSEMTATFGLGQASHVDSLWVHWPGGVVTQFDEIQANQTLLIKEGEGIVKREPIIRGNRQPTAVQ